MLVVRHTISIHCRLAITMVRINVRSSFADNHEICFPKYISDPNPEEGEWHMEKHKALHTQWEVMDHMYSLTAQSHTSYWIGTLATYRTLTSGPEPAAKSEATLGKAF